MENDEKKPVSPRKKRKITPERLKNIALYYLERFDSSADNLRRVLSRRVFDHARENPDFDRRQAEAWIEVIIAGFERVGYLDDARYAEAKISAYLAAGKPERWIRQKMKQKGVQDEVTEEILSATEIDEEKAAENFARKKKIGPFRKSGEERNACRQKDLAALVRAGFGYEIAKNVIGGEFFDESI